MPTIDTPAGDFEVTGVAFPDDPDNAEVIEFFGDPDEYTSVGYYDYESGFYGYGNDLGDPFNDLDGMV